MKLTINHIKNWQHVKYLTVKNMKHKHKHIGPFYCQPSQAPIYFTLEICSQPLHSFHEMLMISILHHC